MNKKFYSFGIAALMLLMSGNAMATDYYLSANGDDANDGKTAATALKTLSAVLAKVQTQKEGEHIYVSGMITVDAECSKAHCIDLVFEGEDPETDGFDAKGKNGILNLNNTSATFKNLSFRNGYKSSTEKGAAAIWGQPLRLTLENCVFEGNKVERANTNENAGALFVSGAQTNTNIKREGGIFATNCKFVNNTTEAGGAAFTAGSDIVDLKNCYFQNNTATNNGGAIYANQPASIHIDGCTFEGNETTTSRGGAIYVYMVQLTGKTYTLANSTFYKNRAKGEGGAFAASDQGNASNNTINFVHCTMTGNATQGTIEGAGGISVNKKSGTVNIVNSILQGNLAETNANQFADVTFYTTKVNFINSYVGAIRKYDENVSNYNITNGLLNNLTSSSKETELGEYKEDTHIIPLKSSSAAKEAADLSADLVYDVLADQLGTKWTKPYIGAVQLDEEEYTTGISGIKADAPKSIKGIYNIAGQYVGNDASGLAKGLYIINGKKVVIK